MKKTAIGFSAAALALAGTAALSQGPMGKVDTDGDGSVTRAEMASHGAAMFARMDANGDGVINAEDRAARRAEMFAKADTNGDGELSQAEMEARRDARMERREARAERMAERFANMDTDNSGGLTQEEMQVNREARGKRGHHGKRGGRRGGMMMLRMADADGDKSITRAEFDAAQAAHFARIDTNGDGTITAAEREAAHQKMRAEWKAKREADR